MNQNKNALYYVSFYTNLQIKVSPELEDLFSAENKKHIFLQQFREVL